MTTVNIIEGEDENKLLLTGHAGYGISGTDIVCAAISTLAYTWINQLEKMKEENVVEEFEYQEADGLLFVRWKGKNKKIKHAFDTVNTGFLMLQDNFFENIRVIRGEI